MTETATPETTVTPEQVPPVAPITQTATPPVETKTPESILGGAKAPDSKSPETPAIKTEATVAPEKYADFKLPEGVQLDKTLVEKAVPLFKELNLSQENAQKLVTFQAESVKAEVDARLADFDKTIKGWREESMKFLGAEPEKERAFAGKALDAFGSPELRDELTKTGYGDNPRLLKMMVAVGKAMSEARTIGGSNHAPMDDLTATKLAMFPSMRDQILAGNGSK